MEITAYEFKNYKSKITFGWIRLETNEIINQKTIEVSDEFVEKIKIEAYENIEIIANNIIHNKNYIEAI